MILWELLGSYENPLIHNAADISSQDVISRNTLSSLMRWGLKNGWGHGLAPNKLKTHNLDNADPLHDAIWNH